MTQETPVPEKTPVTEEAPVIKYGTVNNRLIAATLDVGLVLLVALPITDWMLEHFFAPVNADAVMAVLTNAVQNPEGSEGALLQVIRDQHIFERSILENLSQLVFIALYTLPFWFRYSTTPGKMLFGLQIRDEKTGERMTRKQAIIRFLGYIVSGIPLSLGFIWAAFNKKKQGWHDMIAGTVVTVKPKKK